VKIIESTLLLISSWTLLFDFCFAQNNFWEPINGPVGGIVYSLTTDTNGCLYAGTSLGGVLQSTNNDNDWNTVNHDLTNLCVRSLTIDNEGYIFAGTGYTNYDGAIFRSIANPPCWVQLNIGFSNLIYSLAVDSNGNIFAGSIPQGVSRSTDHGETWLQTNNGITNTLILSLAINSDGHIYAGTCGGLFISTDKGDNWFRLSNGLTDSIIACIAIKSNIYFAGTSTGIFRSTNNGDVWVQMTDISNKTISISKNGDIIAGTLDHGIFRSTDNGDSWSQINQGLADTSICSLHINHNGTIYIGTVSGRICKSTDYGDTWFQVNKGGLTNLSIWSLGTNSQNDIFVGTQDGDAFRSTNNGESWIEMKIDTSKPLVFSLSFDSLGNSFAGTRIGIFRSSDNGETWTFSTDSSVNIPTRAFLICQQNNIFAATTRGIFRSTNAGDSWTQVNNGITDTSIWSLTKNRYGVIFAGANNGKIFRSIDFGDTWKQTKFSIPGGTVFSLAANSYGYLFAGMVDPTGYRGCYISSDNGDNWEKTNLPNYNVMSLNINSNDHIFAGTNYYVYQSTDNGQTWQSINKGLTDWSIRTMIIDKNGYLYAGTYGGGICRSTQSTVTSVMENRQYPRLGFTLEQNYPNPFNPSTAIRYQLPVYSFVTLKIYNLLGQEVATLVDEFQNVGYKSVEWHTNNIGSGVYFYKLTAGKIADVKKMILLR